MSKSSTVTEGDELPNPSPGDILRLDFLAPAGLTSAELARELHVDSGRISEVLSGRRSVNADLDLRLARYFALSPGFFLGLQADFDLMQRRRELGDELETIKPRAA
jgi:addiction module HigA family antidote